MVLALQASFTRGPVLELTRAAHVAEPRAGTTTALPCALHTCLARFARCLRSLVLVKVRGTRLTYTALLKSAQTALNASARTRAIRAPASKRPSSARSTSDTARSTRCVLILSCYAILTVRRSRLVARTKLADSTRNAKRSTRRISILARCARLARAQANLISKLAFSARQARTARARLAKCALHTLAFTAQSTQTPCVPVRACLTLFTTRRAKRGTVLPIRTIQAV